MSAPSIAATGKIRLLALIAVLVLVGDILTKVIGVAQLEGQPPVPILGGLVYLQLVRNPGAAFSLATGYTWILTLVAVAVVVVIIRVARRLRSTGWAVALGLILGGALGNLTDRVFRSPGPLQGHVVDTVSLFAPDGQVWPVFNLADSCIVSGGVLLMLLALLGRELDGTRSGRKPADEGTSRRPTVSDTRRLPVPDGLDGMRVDAGLSRLLGLSRTAVVALTETGGVELDGRAAGKSDRLTGGSWLEVRLPDPAPAAPITGPVEVVAGLSVLHADDDIVVVDKPVGVAAHPSPGWTGPTVLGGLAALGHRVSTSGVAERQGIVHRLDVGTTGVMVVATSERAYTELKRAFKARTVDKRYHAVAQGHPDPSSGTIDAPIDRHPRHDHRFAVVAGGRPSVTHYDTLEAFRAASLLDIRLETGRTHQIRVHLAAVRHPCVGDLTYGADPTLAARLGLTRQWLHARSLGFAHPADGRWVQFTSPYPADLERALQQLRD